MTFGFFFLPDEHRIKPVLDSKDNDPVDKAADPMVFKNSLRVVFFMISSLFLNKLDYLL